ncbi:uncharacterized protein LOC124530939 [Vanessa cardui]|uniref:uncharacterized protein LOC124530939 n=1 Tax=Vanessa cardui TaxID=171605 RepID=UPI001F12D83C|nr:uncharacterized protein LOC124530939 [Vanessa cardui]
MNSKKLKKKKEDIFFSNVMHDNPEVLVLPPNILEKLGINLGNIQPGIDNSIISSCTEIVDNAKDLAHTLFTEKPGLATESSCINASNKETSILKTANLMKESVLLSPTFSATKTYDVINEEDINFINNPEVSIQDNQISSKVSKHYENNHNGPSIDRDIINTYNNILDFDKARDENKNIDVNDIHKPNNDDNITSAVHEIDISNSNIYLPNKIILSEKSEHSDKSLKDITPKNSLEPKNKINILSHEILDANKIKELKKFHKTESNALIPVKMDTNLSKNNKSITEKSVTKTLDSQNSLNELQPMTDISNGPHHNDHIRNVNVKCSPQPEHTHSKESKDANNYKLSNKMGNVELLNKNYSIGDKLVHVSNSKEENEAKETDQSNYLIWVNQKDQNCLRDVTLSNLSHVGDISKENVENQTSNNFQNQHSKCDCDEPKNNKLFTSTKSFLDNKESVNCVDKSSDISEGDSCKDKKINSDENIATSKLCIQGVEKPGGQLIIPTINGNVQSIKTYSKIKKTVKKIVNNKVTNLGDCVENNADIDYKTNEADSDSQVINNFCICKDFGAYNYYESANSYEHIHYLIPTNINCSLEVLFSIYEDEYSDVKKSKNEQQCFVYNEEPFEENCVLDESINNKNNICWYTMENVDNNSNIQSNDCLTSKNQQKITPRESSTKIGLGNNLETKTNACNEYVNGTNNNQYENIKKKSRLSNGPRDYSKRRAVDENNLKTKEDYNSERNMICQQNLESNKNQSRKRKRASVSDSDDDDAIPGPDTIVCQPCGKKVPKIDWENHISKRHCFIAWTEGQTINFEDKKLLLKLNRRLCDTGKLVCSFCDTEHNALNKFINHVQKCINKRCTNNKITREMRRHNTNSEIEQSSSRSVNRLICGVCQSEVEENLWFEHIGKEHNYLAWEQGEPPLDCTDEEKVLNILSITRKTIGRLECSNCGVSRKFVKAYVNHLKSCANIVSKMVLNIKTDELLSPESAVFRENEIKFEKSKVKKKITSGPIKCGVCHVEVEDDKWIDHICKEHSYLAWKEGETELNVEDAKEVYDHLYDLTKDIDGLICPKCGIRRKYVKSFLTHIESCTGPSNTTLDGDDSYMTDLNDTLEESIDPEQIVKCGVCQKELEQKYWINHIQKEHAYMAWKEGQRVLNLDNQLEILQHLNYINKKYNGLVCNKCGIVRKYVKVFLSHIETCDSTFVSNSSLKEEGIEGSDSYECAVCAEVVDPKDWKSHAMKKHYNVAWVVGDFPIDVKNPHAVENCLKEYRKHNKKLECRLCGVARVSIIGFYAHIIQCGKTEEEVDEFKNYCEICNSKYLCIYKYQHLQMHKEQEFAKEKRKELESKVKLDVDCQIENEPADGRQAAKRARNVIGKYQKFEFNCNTCGFGADEENELEEHACGKMKYRDFSDSEQSVHLDSSSGDESDITEIDSNASASEMDSTKEKWRKHGESRSFATRIKRIPFEIKNPKDFLNQSAEDFRRIHYTSDTLYPQWRYCKYKSVPDDEICKYMPPLEQSCKLLMSQREWKTLSKFQACKETGGYSVFVGGSVQRVSWAPGAARGGRHFLAVSCHNASDCPRLGISQTHSQPSMLQIWDFGDLTSSIPKFVFGIAHDYGTVWSIDWCASGARDNLLEHSKTFQRLGLLAAACSNGSAYIFSVPYPSTIIDSDKVLYNLTPVAELRISRGERSKFQATSISWSQQVGHSVVLVGYSDGTTALFDLQGDSPLLKEAVNGVDIIYPYHDERSHNTCITGVSTLASGARGGVCVCSSASPTGADSARRGAAAVRLRAHLPCSAAAHTPHWPSALLAENDGIVTQAVNELDWWGWGQRLGAVHGSGVCVQCGALAAYASPLLRVMTPHPAYSSLNKEPVAFINMTPLAKKRTKKKTDELAIKLEPRTYEDAIKTYGVEFKFVNQLDKHFIQQINNKPKELCHERFPLSDVTSMAFNPSPKHHRKIALATHAGFIFVVTV